MSQTMSQTKDKAHYAKLISQTDPSRILSDVPSNEMHHKAAYGYSALRCKLMLMLWAQSTRIGLYKG